jgi:hypothetical protein
MNINENQMISYGEYYGYPSCCIRSFHDILLGKKNISLIQLNAGNGSGFIPCLEHAKQVQEEKIKLEEIILPTRMCEGKFPHGRPKLSARVKETE